MKTLKIRIVSLEKLSAQMKKEFDDARKVVEIPGRLNVEFKYAVIKDVLSGCVMESDLDIDERWLASKIFDARYHSCHLQLTGEEWKYLGLRTSLWGQSALVNNQVITYGRWNEGSWKDSSHYIGAVRKLTELSRGVFHENGHGFNELFAVLIGVPYAGVRQRLHHAFYGWERVYTKLEEEKGLAKRWVETPTPLEYWQSLPWELLPDTLQTQLEKLQEMLKKLIAQKEITDIHPLIKRKMDQLFAKAKAEKGYVLRMVSGFRSFVEQAIFFAQGRSTPGPIVTYARPGESFHNYGVAFDVVDRNHGYDIDWEELGKIGESIGLEWGGRWPGKKKDNPHFQLTLGYSLKDFQDKKVDYQKFN